MVVTTGLAALGVLGIELFGDSVPHDVASSIERSGVSAVAGLTLARVPTGASTGPAGSTPSSESVTGSSSAEPAPVTPSTVPPPMTGSERVPTRGTGTFSDIAVTDAMARSSAPAGTRTIRYRVEIEGGLAHLDAADFARTIATVLADERGWQPIEKVHYEPLTKTDIAAGRRADLRFSLTSPDTVDRLCVPVDTSGEYSCYTHGRVVINAKRWVWGVPWFGDLTSYRTYLINHEVGHDFDHGHVDCPAPGRRAPIMQQQSIDLDGCMPWPWPQGDGS